MKAIHVTRRDGTLAAAELALVDNLDVPSLDPTSANLLLRVLACALNPGDVKFLTGALRGRAVPFTPGLEVCGVVVAVGANAATNNSIHVGDRVVAVLRAMHMGSTGGLAQYVVVEAALAAVVPPTVSTELAVALPLAGTMALQAIKDAAITDGSRVLVLGAASCVGRLVVQLAKRAGASFVAGTTPTKEPVASLPLDHAIVDDGQHAPWYDALRSTKGFDVVVDCAGEVDSWRHADKVLVPRPARSVVAVLLSEVVCDGEVRATSQLLTLGFVGMWKNFWRAGAKLQIVAQFPSTETLRELLALVETHELTPALDASTPLAFTPSAVQHGLVRLASRQQSGKLVVVTIPDAMAQ